MDANAVSAARLLQAVREQTNPAQAGKAASLLKNLAPGQELRAEVVDIPRAGVATVNINGTVITIPVSAQLTQGQQVLMRVATASPNVLMDVLGVIGEKAPASNPALAALVQGQQSATQLWEGLLQASGSRGESVLPALVPTPVAEAQNALQQLLTRLNPQTTPQQDQQNSALLQTVRQNSAAMRIAISQLIQQSSSALQQLLFGDASEGLRNSLQQLSQLLSNAGQQLNALATAPLEAPVQRAVQTLLSRFTPVMQAEAQALPAQAQQALEALAGRLNTASNYGELMRSLTTARALQQQFADTLQAQSPRQAEALDTLRSNLEQLLLDTRTGQQLLRGNALLNILSSASNSAERFDSLTQLNPTVAGDRSQNMIFMFPFAFDEEVAEVHLHHSGSGKKQQDGKPLTMVMMLNLESLGKLRLDTLLHQKKVHCHIYVEDTRLATLITTLKPSLAESLAAHELTLSGFACSADDAKLDQAEELVKAFGDDGQESLVNVQI